MPARRPVTAVLILAVSGPAFAEKGVSFREGPSGHLTARYTGSPLARINDLVHGRLSALPVLSMLGEPDIAFVLGGVIHACYSKQQIDLVYDEDGPLLAVLPFHRRVSRGLPRDTRAEMRRLEGLWRDADAPDLSSQFGFVGTNLWFDGDRVVLFGGGFALGFYYEIDATKSPHVLQFYYPDARDDASWNCFFKKLNDKPIPRRWVFKFEGPRLVFYPESVTDQAAEKEATGFKRLPLPEGFGK